MTITTGVVLMGSKGYMETAVQTRDYNIRCSDGFERIMETAVQTRGYNNRCCPDGFERIYQDNCTDSWL